ncbi:MAG: quinolinate synthase NadA [Candidatus Thermoplasmatota archaeon]|nr:quinolinate synthase NadA [Candidatus Thermoplasmatota archaeon]
MKDFVERVTGLKEQNDVVLLVHNYQRPEVQDVADFLGDSLDLAERASKVSQQNIVFCGVDFMAESAKILNPGKRVVHPISPPNLVAKCPMAGMVDAEGLESLKREHPDAVVVSYVNTTADVKAISDVCCTSANAVNVISSLPEEKVIFVPDTNLGLYVMRFVTDKELILWPGYCRTHVWITAEEIEKLKAQHPDAEVIVHPECTPDVIDLADTVGSTQGMVKRVKESDGTEFIIGTEKGLVYRLKKENPDKEFYYAERAVCPNMKEITPKNVLRSMETLDPEVVLDEDTIERARIPLQRMVAIGRTE